MSDIPSDVYHKILLQLPAESLFRFRCVCKEWRQIIDDPSFIRSHANSQHSSTTLLIRTQKGTPIFYLDSLNFVEGRQIIEFIRAKTLRKRGVPRLPELPVASCNGLILISHFEINKIWVVWNPLTREFHELPQLNMKKMRLLGCGIGYDSATDDYKVVRIDRAMTTSYMCQTHIYSLKLKSWKNIENCPLRYPLSRIGEDQGVYLHGTLHWLSDDIINALHLRTEEYSQLTVPPIPDKKEIVPPIQYGTLDVNLAVLSESLIVSFFYSLTRFDVWIMKDYGVVDSWMKLFSLGNLDYTRAMWGIRPIAYIKSKGHVLLQHDCMFFWLDIEKNIMKKFPIDGFPYDFTSQICPGSLVRLPDSCDGLVAEKTTGAKRKRTKKNNTRLKLPATVNDLWYHSDSDYASEDEY